MNTAPNAESAKRVHGGRGGAGRVRKQTASRPEDAVASMGANNVASDPPKRNVRVVSAYSSSHTSSESESYSSKISVNDDLRRELGKHDIQVDKWYHKLLTGQYYNSSGMYYYESEHTMDGCWSGHTPRTNTMYSTMEISNEIPILKKLAMEYQRSLSNKNIPNLVLIRNELLNHLPEQLWIHNYLTGDVYDANGKPLNRVNPEMEELAKQYSQIYHSSVQNCSG